MRIIGMLYGLTCYLLGTLSFLLVILFANNHMAILGIPSLTALNIDSVNVKTSNWPILTNVGLILLFGVQHSVMARPGFKAALTKVLPENWERSTYVLATTVVLAVLVYYWQPVPGSLWIVEDETARVVINVLFYTGWLITFSASYMINHFHLFGLQQTLSSEDALAVGKEFRTPLFYRVVRHPIQTGTVIAMFATPDMTTGRAILAAGVILYIFVGLYFEERDLIKEFGVTYCDYKRRVPALIPTFRKKLRREL